MAERGRGRAEAWRPWSGHAPAWTWPDAPARLRGQIERTLRRWAAAEAGAGRLLPWLPVAFGTGVVLYFTADHEPLTYAPALVLALLAPIVVLVRQRPVAFALSLGVAALIAGFAAATLKQSFIAHPVLTSAAWNVEVAGFVEARDERPRSDRIVVRVSKMTAARLSTVLERIRVSVRKGTAPAVGSFVQFRARLSPPLQPQRPGGYDYARDLYFQRIGASGFVLGRIQETAPAAEAGLRLHVVAAIEGLRTTIDRHIRAVLSGDRGSIASALITGENDAISEPVYQAMFISSLGHVLSISGYHMAVVAGLIFFILRAGLALIPALASRYPIKKWAAPAALAGAAFYLMLSGGAVATQRSFVMIAIVLIGVMVDRPALTMRTLTIAALAVLLLAPEAVAHPSFQMSFAATLALIAGYTGGLDWTRPKAGSSVGTRVALWGGREVTMLVIASLLAGAATTPYAAFHFHRMAPYGVLANLAAMPVVSAVVMPAGILGVLALPFGFDGPCWWLMGQGVDWMITVAQWVTNLPGAVGRVHAFGTGPLLTATLGLLVLSLLRTPLRLAGAGLVLIAALWAIETPQPDILASADGATFAVRTASGRLAILRTTSDKFAAGEWLGADADERLVADKTLATGINCDDSGCVGHLADGRSIALARSVDAFGDDCVRAAVVVSPNGGPAACGALVLDREQLRRSGTVALRVQGNGFVIDRARARGYDRPWAPALPPPRNAEVPDAGNATPNPDDLDPGD